MPEERDIPQSIKERIDEYDRNLDRWTYYEILYVTRSASISDIKRAYRKIVSLMHPDRYGHNLNPEYKEKLERIFNEINLAYNILTDESERIQYDQSLYKAEDHGQPLKVDTDTKVAEAQYKRGILAMQKKELVPAIEFFRSAAKLNPKNPEYYAKLAFALSKHPNPRMRNEAFEACKEAIKINHESANYHALMGFIYQQFDDIDNAEVHYRRALTWDPEHRKSKEELKKIAYEKNQRKPKGLKGVFGSILKPKKSDKKKN